MEQMIDTALIVVQRAGLYELGILEWNGFGADHKTWPDFKAHFGKAYDTHLRSGSGTANANGYHGAANATDAMDNNSIRSIHESFEAIKVANNTNFQVTTNNLLAMVQDSKPSKMYW